MSLSQIRFAGPWLAVLLFVLLATGRTFADNDRVGLKPDVRLLIDTSSSMEASDPENLRGPALDLMVLLLPDGARAGVWSFGDEVAVLVPHGVVDDAWRNQARKAIALIDNSADLTNTPAAIRAATFDLDRLDPRYRTSIVLLTDGKVEVAESPMVNAAAARDLLANEAQALGVAGVPVHTIALSGEADWVFLESLAGASGGIAEQAADAGDLTEIFLQSLEMVAPTSRVAVEGNRFFIDETVEEFGALVFFAGKSKNRRLELTSPGGQRYQPDNTQEGVDWFWSDKFELVNVHQPEPGEWTLRVPRDATVRVAVISDLALGIDPPPYSMPWGRQAELGLWITNSGAPITDPQELSAFELTVESKSPGGNRERINVSDTYPAPADGEYRLLMPVFEESGRYELTVRLARETLQREIPLYIDVSPPPGRATLVTRGEEPPGDDLTAPLAILAAVSLIALLVIWLILRRRKQRKLEIWERRSRQLDGGSLVRDPLAGVSDRDSKDPDAA